MLGNANVRLPNDRNGIGLAFSFMGEALYIPLARERYAPPSEYRLGFESRHLILHRERPSA